MKFVIQRVSEAACRIDEKVSGEISRGFLVLIGISNEDTKEIADKMRYAGLACKVYPCFLNSGGFFIARTEKEGVRQWEQMSQRSTQQMSATPPHSATREGSHTIRRGVLQSSRAWTAVSTRQSSQDSRRAMRT